MVASTLLKHEELLAGKQVLKGDELELFKTIYFGSSGKIIKVALARGEPISILYGKARDVITWVVNATDSEDKGARIDQLMKGLVRPTVHRAEELDALVGLEVRSGTPLYGEYWHSRPELRMIYQAVAKRDASGAILRNGARALNFLGHGGWYDYLLARHNVGVLRQSVIDGKAYSRHFYPGEVRSVIGTFLLRRRMPSHVEYWKHSPECLPLYQAAEDSTEKGVSFFGYGDWYSFLEGEYNISPVRTMEYGGRKYTRDFFPWELTAGIKHMIESGAPREALYWIKQVETPFYYRVREKGADGRTLPPKQMGKKGGYFGRKSWAAFIKDLEAGRIPTDRNAYLPGKPRPERSTP